jgi:single-stranded DNA-binding protein
MAARGVNHCLLEAEVLEAPQLRYTQDNQTPIAEMTVRLDGLRPDDPPGQLKVVGWGNLAQDLQQRVQVGQRFVLEGRMRMNTVTRQDGIKEKRAELTLSRFHPLGGGAAEPQLGRPAAAAPAPAPAPVRSSRPGAAAAAAPAATTAVAVPPPSGPPVWNTSPLVPEDSVMGEDDIPF